MNIMKAFLKNYRQSPRKVRLLADLIRGKEVAQAKLLLKFSDKKAARAVLKLLNSAVANALQKGADEKKLVVKEVIVNEGMKLKRYMPRAFGRATPFWRRSSHISIKLEEKANNS